METNASIPSDTIAVLEDTKHFQLQITNQVKFAKFSLTKNNRTTFTVQDAVEKATQKIRKIKQFNSTELGDTGRMTFHEIAMKGGTIIVNVHWNCFFWWLQDNQEFFNRNCDPTISFDLIVERPNEMIGRFVHKPEYNGLGDKMTRDLYKVYGIWFKFSVASDVSRFSLMKTLQVLLVGLVSIKVSDRIFEFVASLRIWKFCNFQCSEILLSKEFENAQYVDIPETPREHKEYKNASENGTDLEAARVLAVK